ncbi:hypothetical protein [Flavobacterium phycosphaerae]|uniref:hypothetical protein n=1 Tax=Flavobacterium phycosphaerae TaxID=2697515 RepID=UPI00138A1839|nr:hypothetical protein [Flavobacterium phycosphaerae]
MKTKLFTLLLLVVVSNSFSQTALQLLSATKKFYTANYEMDFETITALSYPKMVETIGKEVLQEQLDKSYQNDEYRLRYQLESMPFITRKIQKIGNQSFCVVSCRNPVRYFYETKLSAEEAAAKIPILQEINHTKDVTFEPKRNSFNVKRSTTYLAVFDETTNGNWAFFNLDDDHQKAAFKTLFDEKTQTVLGLGK